MTTTVERSRTVNLATERGFAEFLKDIENNGPSSNSGEATDVIDLLLNGHSAYHYNRTPIFITSGDYVFVSVGNVFYFVADYLDSYTESNDIKNEIATLGKDGCYVPSAVIVKGRQPEDAKKKAKHFAILNADEDDTRGMDNHSLVDELSDFKFPSVSFICLTDLLGLDMTNDGVREACKMLASGHVVLVDYVCDEYRDLTTAEKRRWTNNKKRRAKGQEEEPLHPPAKGFTLVDSYNDHPRWHRTATVVLYEKGKKRSFLLGRDEGSYFGVELADNPKSVEDAFVSLMPPAVRHRTQGVDWKRQGEWFLLKTNDFPSVEKRLALNMSEFALPVDDPESNLHQVRAHDGFIGPDGTVYAQHPTVEHSNGDHEEVKMSGWVAFLRNTARRSVSVEGVD